MIIRPQWSNWNKQSLLTPWLPLKEIEGFLDLSWKEEKLYDKQYINIHEHQNTVPTNSI